MEREGFVVGSYFVGNSFFVVEDCFVCCDFYGKVTVDCFCVCYRNVGANRVCEFCVVYWRGTEGVVATRGEG